MLSDVLQLYALDIIYHTISRTRFMDCVNKLFQKSEIRPYYGSGWVGAGLTRNVFVLENHPKIALNQY